MIRSKNPFALVPLFSNNSWLRSDQNAQLRIEMVIMEASLYVWLSTDSNEMKNLTIAMPQM